MSLCIDTVVCIIYVKYDIIYCVYMMYCEPNDCFIAQLLILLLLLLLLSLLLLLLLLLLLILLLLLLLLLLILNTNNNNTTNNTEVPITISFDNGKSFSSVSTKDGGLRYQYAKDLTLMEISPIGSK